MKRSRTLKRWARSRSVTKHAVMEETMRGMDVTKRCSARVLEYRATAKLVVGAVMVLTLGSSCVPHVDEQTSRTPRPSLSERPRTTPERRDLDPEVTASVEGNAVKVRVQQKTECRDVISTPMEQDELTKRTLANGTLAQGTNLVLAGGLAAIGIAVLASADGSCTKTADATAQNPNPTSRPCTPEEEQQNKQGNTAVGIGFVGASVIPLGLFVWNILRAKDEKKTTHLSAKVEQTTWKGCDTKPVSNASISLRAGTVSTTAKTDQNGAATLDLAEFVASTSDPKSGLINVDAGGRTASASAILSGAPFYSTWSAKQLAEANARLAEQAEAKHARELKLLEEVERGLPQIKGKWDDAKMALFAKLAQNVKSISGESFTPKEKSRLTAAMAGFDSLVDSYNDQVRDAQARADQGKVHAGRRVVLSRAKSPSTVRFISDAVVLSCPGGFITLHEFDGQNAFGAMIRSRVAVEIDTARGRIDSAEESSALAFSLFVARTSNDDAQECKTHHLDGSK